MDLPFDGAITRYYEDEAPEEVRQAIRDTPRGGLLDPSYPHDAPLGKKDYRAALDALQVELVKLQAWVRDSGTRLAVIFEGRDAAGKGGAIKRVRMNLNPRVARLVALGKPSDRDRAQWYFQRYIPHLPAAGEMVLFDRSWYNRAVVEPVFGFCTPEEREHFLTQAPEFENMLVDEGIVLIKIWLNVGRAEQLRRFLRRESNPLKQWKISEIDVGGLPLWHAYSDAIADTFLRTHTGHAPWTVIRGDDKKRARLAVIRRILSAVDYSRKDRDAVGIPDPLICGGPEIWNG